MADRLNPGAEREDVTLQDVGEVEVRELAPGTSVGRYTVLELLGRGGMGAVYKAYDPELDRSIALKVISPQSTGSEPTTQAHGRVMREAQALAQLAHPNVVAVFDVGRYEGAVYIAMELIEGKSGQEWLQAGLPGRKEALEVFRQAGEGLWAAHQAGLVHRDFKPGNMILGKDSRVRVADFGLVRSLNTPALPEEEEAIPVEEADRRARAGGYMGMLPDELDCLLCDETADPTPLEGLLGRPLRPLDEALAAAVRAA